MSTKTSLLHIVFLKDLADRCAVWSIKVAELAIDAELRLHMANLTREELDDVLSELFVALNDGRVRADVDGPLLSRVAAGWRLERRATSRSRP